MTLNSAQLYVMLNQYGRHLERRMANLMHVFNNTNEYDVHAFFFIEHIGIFLMWKQLKLKPLKHIRYLKSKHYWNKI